MLASLNERAWRETRIEGPSPRGSCSFLCTLPSPFPSRAPRFAAIARSQGKRARQFFLRNIPQVDNFSNPDRNTSANRILSIL